LFFSSTALQAELAARALARVLAKKRPLGAVGGSAEIGVVPGPPIASEPE
jgi:hypothetical protein